jgi:hypothetical protein
MGIIYLTLSYLYYDTKFGGFTIYQLASSAPPTGGIERVGGDEKIQIFTQERNLIEN